MNQPWSNLPNAHHIDWVIESLRENPQLWATAWCATGAERDAAFNSAGDAVWTARRDAVWTAGRGAAWDAAREATYNSASAAPRRAAWDAAWRAAWEAVAALIAYDDCDQYLVMGYKKLLTYTVLSEEPQALLLLPIAYVKEQLNNNQLLSA